MFDDARMIDSARKIYQVFVNASRLFFFFFSTDTDLTANGCYTRLMTSPHITKLTSFFI